MTVVWSKSSYSLSNGHCVEIGIEDLDFFKSNYSIGGDCVEVADAKDVVFVRDTKNRDQGMLELSKESFNNFIKAIKLDEFSK